LWGKNGSLESPHDGMRRRRVKAITADISGTKDRAKEKVPILLFGEFVSIFGANSISF